MDNIYSNVACGGMDVHYKFSNVTFRDKDGRVVRRYCGLADRSEESHSCDIPSVWALSRVFRFVRERASSSTL